MPEKFDDWHEFERAHQDRDHKGISSLHKKLEPFLLRRVKKDVEKSLPAKVEQILRVDMTTRQKQYYKLILTRNYDELSKGVKGSINGFINVMMELKKCCNHCCLVRNDDYMEEEAQARLQQLLKSSGKLILLDKLLCRLKETGHRVLIFSQMVMMLDLLQEYMQLRRFATQRLDGSMRADLRKQALDHFNAPGSNDFCFLLSTRAGGLGINLATADTVIIFDSDWNPQNDLQAMSRAHRIGQKNQVNIYRLVTKASVEEEIVERAKQKLVLDHLVIQRMDTTGKTVLSKNAMGQSSKSMFDKADLNAILKFGAEELFKERLDGEAQEPEVDIDDILRRAETRECENHQNDNELLNSFKYANFAIDEEKDLASFGQHDHSNDATNVATTSSAGIDGAARTEDKDWKDIIPKTRQRPKIARETSADNSDDETDDEDESSGDSDSGEETRGKKANRRKILFNFTEKEIRRFVKSFRKFAMPLSRLDAIAQDAELEEHSTNEIAELVYEFLRRFQESTAEYENGKQQKENGKSPEDTSIVVVKKKQDRGPIFKIGQVDVYVRPIMKMQSDLEPLHKAIEDFKAQLSPKFQIPGKPKRQLGWDVEWEDEDDVSLLRGIYQYGLGSWEAIKMDPEFGLVDKIWLKDKVKKPQPKHLQCRAEYLLRHLAKAFKVPDSPPKKRSKTDPNAVDGGDIAPSPPEEAGGQKGVTEDGEDDHKASVASPSPSKKWRSGDQAQVASITLNIVRYKNDLKDRKSAMFKKCVELFRPVHKAIKKLNGEKPHSEQGLRHLLKLGDHITGCIVKMIKDKEPSSTQDKWYNYLWIFLSMFLDEEHDPSNLLNTYKQCVRNRDKEEANNSSNHKNSSHHSQVSKLVPVTPAASRHSHFIPPPTPQLHQEKSREH
uniref:Helicase C-terminal domain-containing protein n=1 Tax=Ditylenchus dipsaci TaxID=166011 RepID=A0A915DK52_9BILA